MVYRIKPRRGRAHRALGGPTFEDQCLTEQALKDKFPKYCSCYAQWGRDAQGPGFAGDAWVAAIAAAWTFAAEANAPVVAAPQPPLGPAPWGSRFDPLDWTGSVGQAWLNGLVKGWSDATGAELVCGDGTPIRAPLTTYGGLCALICPNPGAQADCLIVNNNCVHDGQPNTQTHFGGPVMEFFNFTRVLNLLRQHQALAAVPTTQFGQGYVLDSKLVSSVRAAANNLNDLLGRSWWPFTAFNQQTHEGVLKKLLTRRPTSLVVEQLGSPPYSPAAWLNRLRWLVKRVPGGNGWQSVWNTPTWTDVDTAFNPEDPIGSGKEPVLYRPPTTNEPIVAGEWLANVVAMLAPPALIGATLSKKHAPSPAVTAAAAIAVGASAAALAWWLL